MESIDDVVEAVVARAWIEKQSENDDLSYASLIEGDERMTADDQAE